METEAAAWRTGSKEMATKREGGSKCGDHPILGEQIESTLTRTAPGKIYREQTTTRRWNRKIWRKRKKKKRRKRKQGIEH